MCEQYIFIGIEYILPNEAFVSIVLYYEYVPCS